MIVHQLARALGIAPHETSETVAAEFFSGSLIAAYLAFFPVAVGLLRGLQSPPDAGVELMRSYAAGWWRTLVTLRVPASLPYLFPALRLAGAARLQFRLEVFNVFNQANLGLPGRVATTNSTSFGVITTTRFPTGDSGSARQVQLAAKVMF